MQIDLPLDDLVRFTLVLVRVSALVVAMPVFGLRMIPPQVKVVLVVALSLGVYLTMPAVPAMYLALDLSLLLLVLREVLVGLALGYTASILFRGVEYAGEIVGMQMGFSIATVIDPQSGGRMSIISEWQRIVLVLIFLSVNGHYIFIRAIHSSYVLAPIGNGGMDVRASAEMAMLVGKVFVIALQLAAPATIMLLLTHLVLAVVSRAVPQMNVFIVGFPLTIAVGTVMLAISIPAFAQVVEGLFEGLAHDLTAVLKVI